jgi:hypothetical protein
MRDLPVPASPEISTTLLSPALTRVKRRNSKSISSSGPISGLNVEPPDERGYSSARRPTGGSAEIGVVAGVVSSSSK